MFHEETLTESSMSSFELFFIDMMLLALLQN